MANWLQSVGRLLRQDRAPTSFSWTDRWYGYLLNDAYYDNIIYDAIASGGQRESINATLGNAAAADLAGLYNPVPLAVDLYLHAFDGAFGDEITVLPMGRGSQALVRAIDQIWEWSNLTIEKQPLCRYAANHGCVGIRIVARNDPDPERRRVYLKPEHPRVIRDVELDDRGNVEAIQLEYDVTSGLAEEAQTITIREELTKEQTQVWRVDTGSPVPFDLTTMSAGGPRARFPNPLGVVPYVLVRHAHVGGTWGRNAWYTARSPIDRLNALMCHIDVQIHRHVKAKWLIAAAGTAPTEIDMSDLTVVYVDTRNATTTPVIEPLIANLDLQGAIQQATMQLGIVEDMLPELKAAKGRFLSNQSGETIAELRKPAEDKLVLARANYEDGLIRAHKIAASWGVLLGLWNLGTGMGSREAADRAFREGFEDHRFNKRPLLPSGVSSVAQDTSETGMGEQPPATGEQSATTEA